VSDVYQVLTYAFQEILPPSVSMHALHLMQIDRHERQITIIITINMFRVETSLLAGVCHLFLINRAFTGIMRSEFPLYIHIYTCILIYKKGYIYCL